MLEFLRRHEAGESLAALAADAGVSKSTLTWWRSQLRDHLKSEPVGFVEVTLESPPESPMLVHLGNVTVEVRPGFDREELGRLLSVLQSC